MVRDPPAFDSIGRCLKHHQSPWDLKLTLAASGATMYVGFTLNEVRDDLASIWWKPGKDLQNVTERDKARAVFFDITEAEHQQPLLGEKWRQAWDEGAYHVPPTRQAAAAASSRPAASHPGSGCFRPCSLCLCSLWRAFCSCLSGPTTKERQ